MKIKDFNNYLMYAIVFFIIFSSALNYTYLPAAFSYLKDAIIFYFAILLLRKKIKKPSNIGVSFYILFILVAVVSWLGLLNNTENKTFEIVSAILRYLEFFLLFFIFTNIEQICTISYDKLINFYIKLSIILIFVNIIGYFVPNPIVSIYILPTTLYRNRITVGQPATSAYPMLISYIYLLVYKMNDSRTVIEIIWLLIGIIISTSVTGILSIGVTTVSFIFLNSSKENRKKIIITLVILSIIGSCIIRMVNSIPFLSKVYEKQMALLDVKIRALFVENVHDLSMDTRDNKLETVSRNIENKIEKLIGVGLVGYNANGINVGSLENQYATMKICFGYIGIITFILFILKHIFKGLRKSKEKNELFILLLFLVFSMHAYTLEVISSPTISYTLSLFYCYINKKINNLKGDINFDENTYSK